MIQLKSIKGDGMIQLTFKQEEVLLAIKDSLTVNRFPPSRKELAAIIGVTPNAIQLRIEALAKKGAVTYTQGKQRSTLAVKGFRYLLKEDA